MAKNNEEENKISDINYYSLTSENIAFTCKEQKKKEQKINKISNFDGSYLAGLIEGDGYITITNQDRVIIGITFNIKDKPLAYFILKKIGQGTIVKRKSNSIELRFSAKKSLEYIVNITNGKFRTPKIDQMYRLINWLNHKHNLSIEKKGYDLTSLKSNAWLSGFIEADGHFYIRYSPSQVACKFFLEQRLIYPKTGESYKNIMLKMANSLLAFLKIRDRLNIKNKYYIIKAENQTSIIEIINYLDKFSLISSKYLDYLCWKKAFYFIKNKQYKIEGKEKILYYKNQMNDKRIIFDWNHLK